MYLTSWSQSVALFERLVFRKWSLVEEVCAIVGMGCKDL